MFLDENAKGCVVLAFGSMSKTFAPEAFQTPPVQKACVATGTCRLGASGNPVVVPFPAHCSGSEHLRRAGLGRQQSSAGLYKPRTSKNSYQWVPRNYSGSNNQAGVPVPLASGYSLNIFGKQWPTLNSLLWAAADKKQVGNFIRGLHGCNAGRASGVLHHRTEGQAMTA